jgi:hypothetical protein
MSTSIRAKYASIRKDKISASAAQALEAFKKATDNFKDKDAVNKIEGKFNAFYEKIKESKPEAIRGYKPPSVAAKAAPAKAKSTGRSTSKLSLTNRKRFAEAKKKRTQQALSTIKDNIEKDAKRPALPKGYRISKNGNKYWEGRDNRIDRKPAKYARLEEGGEMEKGGEILNYDDMQVKIRYNQKFDRWEGLHRAINPKTKEPLQKWGFDKNSMVSDSKEDLIKKYKSEYGSSYMAHGGEVHRIYEKKKLRFDDGGTLMHETYEVTLKSTNPKYGDMDGFNGTPLEYYGSNIGEVFEDVMNSIDDDMEIVSIIKK